MESIKIISLIKHYIEFAIQKDKSQKLNKLQEDFKKIDNKAQNLLNQYVNDKINDKYFISTLCLIDEKRISLYT